jgi:hypothetical protein
MLIKLLSTNPHYIRNDHTPITRITFKFNADPWQRVNFENQPSYFFKIMKSKEIKAVIHSHKRYTTANNETVSLINVPNWRIYYTLKPPTRAQTNPKFNVPCYYC